MKWLIVGLLVVHGLIHAMGFAKAFGFAELPQLALPISRAMGVAWLLAGGLVIATAGMLAIGSRHTWLAGAVAVLLSQAVILSAWRDAWAGTLANVVLLLVVAYSWFTAGPRSFQAQFERDAAEGLARMTAAAIVTDADLAPLPAPVQRYLWFDADGWLSNFISDDRTRSSPDGRTFTPLRFSTPVRDHRAFGPLTLAAYGEGRWLLPEGEFVYGEFNIQDAAMNLPPR